MENKQKKKSVNTVIYILMASMLAVIVLVSVFTVTSRKSQIGIDSTEGTSDTSKVTSEKTTTEDSRPTPDSTAPSSDNPPETTDDKKTSIENPEDDKPASTDVRYFVLPAVGTISNEFEIDIPVYSLTMNDYRAHAGVDIAAPIGSDVVASSGGIVSKIWNDPMMGTSITVDHGDNIYTTYKNLAPDSTASYSIGDKVTMGQTIGAVGESALIEIAEEPHVHVEMTVDGNYVDPLEYMSVSQNAEDIYED